MNNTLRVVLMLIGIFSLGILVENSNGFHSAKYELQKKSIPAQPLRLGKRGEILERLGFSYRFPVDYTRFLDAKTGRYRLRDVIRFDLPRAGKKGDWGRSDEMMSASLPSSMVMGKGAIASGAHILSVVVDETDLYDAAMGIFANRVKKGKAWERPCYVSYYENGELKFASGAGVRIHGGDLYEKEAESLRFYFRKIYGREAVDSGIFFKQGGDTLTQLIARFEYDFASAMALDIAREIGCLAPQSRPVVVYLNGKRYGQSFVLTEHLNHEWLKNNIGNNEFSLIRTTGHIEERNRMPEWREFKKWARDDKIEKTMDSVSEKVDVKNLSLWFFSQLFTAGNDIYQGPLVRSKDDSGAKWFWINWDMDKSFRNPIEKDKENLWEQELGFYNVINNPEKNRRDLRTRFYRPSDPRAILFREMHKNDPKFRKYFEAIFMDLLNHRLNPDFLAAWVETQRKQYGTCGIENNALFEALRGYMAHRPGYMRILMKKYFGSADSYPLTIRLPENLTITVDGFQKQKAYYGWYFGGAAVRIEVSGGDRRRIIAWRVNGEEKKLNDGVLRLEVNGELELEPVFSASPV